MRLLRYFLAGVQIDARHARNFAGRDWYCVRHTERNHR